ncbi:uncharacterized protein [Procambarus clarkii]|uniref:uncharacterized protein n=1 Tax=Procambarus clarkii TaxID=6728 RepID=UPI00374398EF
MAGRKVGKASGRADRWVSGWVAAWQESGQSKWAGRQVGERVGWMAGRKVGWMNGWQEEGFDGWQMGGGAGNTASSLCSATQDDSKHNFCPLMMDNKPEECSVCYNDYDDNQLRPRTLPCGHTFCSQCIDNAIKNGQLTCPSCRAQHAATAATQFPISYAVEALVRKLKDIQLTTEEVVPAKPYESPARGISKKLRSLVQEQKSIISSLITSCEEVLSQLGEYRGQLGYWKTCHLQLQGRLYALVEQNKSAMKLLELEDTSVVDMTTQGEERKTRLQAMLGSLDTVNTPQEVDTTIDTADECSTKIKDWLEKCQELFPNVKTVHTLVKVQRTIRAALEMMTTETGATVDPVHLGDSASSIMNKVQEITGEIPQKQLTQGSSGGRQQLASADELKGSLAPPHWGGSVSVAPHSSTGRPHAVFTTQ